MVINFQKAKTSDIKHFFSENLHKLAEVYRVHALHPENKFRVASESSDKDKSKVFCP